MVWGLYADLFLEGLFPTAMRPAYEFHVSPTKCGLWSQIPRLPFRREWLFFLPLIDLKTLNSWWDCILNDPYLWLFGWSPGTVSVLDFSEVQSTFSGGYKDKTSHIFFDRLFSDCIKMIFQNMLFSDLMRLYRSCPWMGRKGQRRSDFISTY